jgi:hypothetical protein
MLTLLILMTLLTLLTLLTLINASFKETTFWGEGVGE